MKDRTYLMVPCHFRKKTALKIFKLFDLVGSSNTAFVEVVQGIIDRNIDREIQEAELAKGGE